MDDMPLYGEESMGKKVLTWVVVVVLAVWVSSLRRLPAVR